MNHSPTVIALVALVAFLAVVGAWTKDAAIITMAASVVTGLFAYLQVHGRKEDK